MSAKRTITIDINTHLGNKLYWFIVAMIKEHPEVITEAED